MSAISAYMGSGRIIKAASWTTFAHVAGQVIRIASQLILARLLAPEMFGIMALATVIQVVLSLLTDVGLRPTVIQSARGGEQVFLNTVWTLQILRGLFIYGANVAIAAGLFIASKYQLLPAGSTWASPELPIVLLIGTVSSIIASLQSTKLISAVRNMDFKRIVYIELLAQVGGLIVTFALAFATKSLYSLVAGWIAGSMITTYLSHYWLPGERNTFAWDRSALDEIYKFGGWVLISSIVYVMATNIDRLLLAGLVTPVHMGLYSIALNLVMMVDGIGGKLLANVALPALSEIARNDPPRFRKSLYRLRLPFDTLFLTAAGFLYPSAQAIVDLVYDHRYTQAGHILQILSVSLIFMRYNLFATVYLALGHPRWSVLVNFAKLVSILILIWVGFQLNGFTGSLWGIALHGALVMPLIFWLNAKHEINDIKFEVMVLGFWIGGYVAGQITVAILRFLFG